MKFRAWDKKNLPSITHGIRTAVAATASVVIARFVQMPEAYWAAIATLVVMQSTLGATLTLSIERIVATAVGASVGGLEVNLLRSKSGRVRGCHLSRRIAAHRISFGEDGISLCEYYPHCSGRNIDGFRPIAPPNKASVAVISGLTKKIHFG
jgi:hypothetical protein